MSLDYSKGAALCKSSSVAHRSAAYMLKDIGGKTPEAMGFAVSHAALAEEEASKAAFCAMVAAGLVLPAVIEPIFQKHPPKTYLFYALLRAKVVELGLGGTKFVKINKQPLAPEILTREILASVGKENIPELRQHDEDRNAGFYLGYENDTWQSPGDGCSDDPVKLVYRYVHRAEAMLLLAEALLGMLGKFTLVDNFRIEETADGWKCTYEEI